MMTFIPLHVLMSQGRLAGHPVCRKVESVITWQEFSNRVVSLAHGLKLRNEERWLLASDDALDFSIQLLALLHADKQVVILPNLQPGTLAQLTGEFDAIVSNELAMENVEWSALPPLDPQLSIINLYTSGSTGIPKCVRKTLAQFEAEINVLEGLWGGLLGHSAIVATVPYHHIYGLIFRILWPLTSGRVFDMVTCANPDILCDRLSKFEKSALISSPAQLSRLPDLSTLTSLITSPELIFSSGGPLSIKTASEFQQQLGCAPIEVFGSTETGGIAWRRQFKDNVWQPFPGVKISRDSEGAIALNSPFLANMSSWRMDDAIDLLPDGKFHLLGRLDRIVKIEEKRLSLPEMESLLATHAWITAAITIPLSRNRQTIGAAVELTNEGQQQLSLHGRRYVTQQLKLHLSEHFEAVLLPRYWRFMDQLPTNEQGKSTYAAISALFITEASKHAIS